MLPPKNPYKQDENKSPEKKIWASMDFHVDTLEDAYSILEDYWKNSKFEVNADITINIVRPDFNGTAE